MDDSSDHLEIEVKFHITNPDAVHQHLVDLGALAQPRGFETNLRFDDDDETLKARHKLLRLRRDKTNRLTYKSKPPSMETECKVYRELEVEVSDHDVMVKILEALGYHQAQIYEKWRRVYHWQDVEICMDTLPFGIFLEIEGPEPSIKAAAVQLQLPWGKRILANYLGMFERLRIRFGLPFNDVTFSNFKEHPADIAPLLHQFEAGTTDSEPTIN